MSHVKRLTEMLLADRHRAVDTDRSDIVPCRACSYTFPYKGRRGDLNGHFCSVRCQDWFDAGNRAPSEIGCGHYGGAFREGARPTREGFMIRCLCCRREFESRGLRCCSTGCESRYRERQDNLAVIAEAGIEATPKKVCANPECRARIPTWRKGRKVSSSTRFCSPKCSRRARIASEQVLSLKR
jgi:hypothetical protein